MLIAIGIFVYILAIIFFGITVFEPGCRPDREGCATIIGSVFWPVTLPIAIVIWIALKIRNAMGN